MEKLLQRIVESVDCVREMIQLRNRQEDLFEMCRIVHTESFITNQGRKTAEFLFVV
jgi:hypothetical protein